jgi:DNA-binding GntR family transcriptional regulator
MEDLASAMGSVDRSGPVSIHAQISKAIREKITNGEWPARYRLKSEPELAEELGVSRGTLRRAISTLIAEGLLRPVRGRGTFVAATAFEPAIAQRLSTLSEDLSGQGVDYETSVLRSILEEPPEPVRAFLDVPNGGAVLRLDRLRTVAEQPVTVMTNFVRTDLAPGLERTDFGAVGLFGTLEGRYGLRIGTARRTFSADSASPRIAALLQLEVGAPVQYMQQVTYLADGRPLEYSDAWIHSGRLKVTSYLARR